MSYKQYFDYVRYTAYSIWYARLLGYLVRVVVAITAVIVIR